MGVVVRAKIQTVEEIYGLIRNAVTGRKAGFGCVRQPSCQLCPHRLGRNSAGHPRVLCYQYGGDSSTRLEPSGSRANWRCMNVEKFSRVEIVDDLWHTARNHSRPQTCISEADVDAEDYPDGIPHSGQ